MLSDKGYLLTPRFRLYWIRRFEKRNGLYYGIDEEGYVSRYARDAL
ncbi:MAG: hypothetical protein DF168_00754 [Candidatus Moanabacter tarae]|uniref:Uncharacterized protein n=1 Tax=Candidatus Moanibacter tarae TaxID=2200854 RepID=A0A2Z4ABX8_9BACT|nr:MAG: hypothetical protein DF168_00754 [Candidatus Moanabacter tarae]